jgi:hypothetical protein
MGMVRENRETNYRRDKLTLARELFPPPAIFCESDLWRKAGIADPRGWLSRWMREGHVERVPPALWFSLSGRQLKNKNLYRFVARSD